MDTYDPAFGAFLFLLCLWMAGLSVVIWKTEVKKYLKWSGRALGKTLGFFWKIFWRMFRGIAKKLLPFALG